MGDRSKAALPVMADDILKLDADSSLSDSVVEEVTQRKSDAFSKASTKNSRKTPPNSSSKKKEEHRKDEVSSRVLIN